jgi:hypothetical protein
MADVELTTTAVAAVGTTLTDLRGRLRVELHDEDSGNYRWTDATLNRHIERAVREVSRAAPDETRTTFSTVADSRDIDVSTLLALNPVEIQAVEWPTGEYPPQFVRWSLFDTTLTLLVEAAPDAVEDAYVYWGKLHSVTAGGSTLPARLEEVVLTGAAGYAALEWASFATNRANIAGVEAVGHYLEYGRAQLARFAEQLREAQERSRVRASALFTPAGPSGRNVVRFEP